MAPQKISDEDLLDAVRSYLKENRVPVAATTQIADVIPIKTRGTSKRLNDLKEEGRINNTEYGTITLWWFEDQLPPLDDAQNQSSTTHHTPPLDSRWSTS
jgi:hypothetical protein